MGRHTTATEHMPEKHRQMGEWTPDRFIRWAESRRIVVLGFRSTFRVWAMGSSAESVGRIEVFLKEVWVG